MRAQLGLLTRRRSAQSPDGTPLVHGYTSLEAFNLTLSTAGGPQHLHRLECCCCFPEGIVNIKVALE